MPAKLVPYVVMMPEGWMPQVCGLCSMDYACHANYSIKVSSVGRCPLANAKKAVEATTDDMETYEDKATGEQTVNGKPVTLYAVEMEGKK